MNEVQATSTSLLPLDLAERRISFKVKGWPYSFVFPRLKSSDWEAFFNGIVVTSENQGKTQIAVVDMSTAGMKLVEDTVLRVEGYANAEEFMQLKDWRQRLLPAHLKAAWGLLCETAVDDTDVDRPIDPLHIEVALRTAWHSDQPGCMLHYRGLVHRFNPPSAEIKRRYNRAMSETRVIGGSRSGKTVYVPRQQLLLGIYDELIAGVDGYSVAGQPLTSADQIRREMDAHHKVMAVKELFTEPDLDPQEKAEEAA